VFRVEFVAGGRARRDYRRKNETVNRLANALSIRDTDVAETVLRLIEEHRERGRELQALRNRLLDHEAAALWREAAPSPLRAGGAARIVARAETGRTFEELRYLAGKIAERGGAVALLGLRAADRGQVAFARSADVGVDVGALLREALGPLGGRGGGRPEAAQGGLPDPGRVEAAIEAARGRLLAD
jgi:alanyl-tRNA synthetase